MKTTTGIIIGALIIAGAIFFSSGGMMQSRGTMRNGENLSTTAPEINNVFIADGTQYVEIQAKGGYLPRVTSAQANMPTVIKVKTQGTFDCASAITIPAIGYRANLPFSGITDIQVPPQKTGSTLQGLCSMGMYSFQIQFN